MVHRGGIPKSSPASSGRQPREDDIGMVSSTMRRGSQQWWGLEVHSRENMSKAKR